MIVLLRVGGMLWEIDVRFTCKSGSFEMSRGLPGWIVMVLTKRCRVTYIHVFSANMMLLSCLPM